MPFLATSWWLAVSRLADLRHGVFKLLGHQPKEANKQQKPPTPPRCHNTYIPIPGSWARDAHPDWPESAYEIPQDVPSGTICYVTKGTCVARGGTAHVERLLSGDVVKYPRPNPYQPDVEESRRGNMRIEAEVYQRLRGCPYVPRLIAWDPETCCLTLENMEFGSLESYLKGDPFAVRWHGEVRRGKTATLEIRQQWTLEAAAAMEALHAANIIHCDATPRNFLLDKNLHLHISDFAGSSLDGSVPTVTPGPRYLPPNWSWMRPVEVSDDLFALGSVLYFIMAGKQPYAEFKDDRDAAKIEALVRARRFPSVSQWDCGSVILGCWQGTFGTAGEVVAALQEAYAKRPRRRWTLLKECAYQES